MSKETEPADTATAPTSPGTPSYDIGSLGRGSVITFVIAFVLLGLLAWGSWSTDLPRVAPEEMASRAFKQSQEAYGIAGFKRTVAPGVEDLGGSTENTFGSSFCYDGGTLGLEDEVIEGAYRMSHSWALDHVPARQAISGLRRLHEHLKDNGWEVTSYREGEKGKNWDLFVQRNDGAERMSFTWFPDREYFTGGASVPCAFDPKWRNDDVGTPGEDQTPPPFGPARRR